LAFQSWAEGSLSKRPFTRLSNHAIGYLPCPSSDEQCQKCPNGLLKERRGKGLYMLSSPRISVQYSSTKRSPGKPYYGNQWFHFPPYAIFDQDRDLWLHTVRETAELDCLSHAKSSAAIGSDKYRSPLSGGITMRFLPLSSAPYTVLHQAMCHTTLRAIGTCGRQWRLSCI